jgi:DNA-binding MarR family transcriptional regulator
MTRSSETETSQQAAHNGSEAHEVERLLKRVLGGLVFSVDPAPELADLPLSQLRCLMAVARRPDVRVNEMAAMLRVSVPAASQAVDRLVRRGMLTRQSDPEDRRAVHLRLTPFAAKALESDHAAKRSRLERALLHLSPDDTVFVKNALRLLADAAEKAQSQEGASCQTFDEDPLLYRRPEGQETRE